MNQLRERGPAAIIRKKRRSSSTTDVPRLADPDFWQLVRKLVEHAELFARAKSLAEEYPDPVNPSTNKP
jgi:hypothetical protein